MLLDAAVPPRSPSYQAFISCIQYLGQGSEGGRENILAREEKFREMGARKGLNKKAKGGGN